MTTRYSASRGFCRGSILGLLVLVGAVGCASERTADSTGARTLDDILKAGTIRIGLNPKIPPRALYDDHNEIVGFEVDVAAEIGRMLGVEVDLVVVGSPDRIPFVALGKVDAVMGAMTRDSKRAKVIDFSVPIHSSSYGVLTRKETGITTWQQLDDENITLVQVRGTVTVEIVKRLLPKANLLLLDNYTDRDRALAQGRADASVDGIDTLAFRLSLAFSNVDWHWFATPGLRPPDYSGFGVAKGNDTLRDWLNIAVYEMHESGFITTRWQEWFGAPMATPVPVTPFF
jgi:polar amino acid transport system substrate-binding protein